MTYDMWTQKGLDKQALHKMIQAQKQASIFWPTQQELTRRETQSREHQQANKIYEKHVPDYRCLCSNCRV